MEKNPTILIVHGAWHNPAFFQPFIRELQLKGFPALCPLLPTCDAAALSNNPHLDMYADARAVRSELRRLVDAEERVLVLAHSYGGVPGIEAVAEELGIKQRNAAGKMGGVIGIFCVCAFLLMPNISLEELNGGEPGPIIEVHADGSTTPRNPAYHFYNDLEPEAQSYWVSKLVPQPEKAYLSKLTQAAYQYVPTAYLFCTNDQATPLFIQKMMVDSAKEAGAQIQEYSCEAGHSPYLSQPQLLIQLMLEYIGVVEGK